MLETIRWKTATGQILDGPTPGLTPRPGVVRFIDQTQLPDRLAFAETASADVIFDAIRRLSIRGAPAIGCGAALGLAAAMQDHDPSDRATFRAETARVAAYLASARPTAVNLAWALTRCATALDHAPASTDPRDSLLHAALAILAEDIALCRAIGHHGAPLIHDGMGVLTHCNAGALATADFGTALAPLYLAHTSGRRFTVYSDETRPLLQGARLTAWELRHAGIDVVTICDNMAAAMMQAGRVHLVIVGADRVAANGDTANKIGTYGLAILAHYHHIPLYVAMPYSTIDLALADGRGIPIEERDPDEVRRLGNRQLAPPDVRVANPAFDVTPHALITGFITNSGILTPPFADKLSAAVHHHRP
jgi:methylthioribose-1-phosphate isomerase